MRLPFRHLREEALRKYRDFLRCASQSMQRELPDQALESTCAPADVSAPRCKRLRRHAKGVSERAARMTPPAPPEPKSTRTKRQWLRVALGVLVFAVVVGLAARSLDVPRLEAALAHVTAWHLTAIFGLAILHVATRALRYHALVRFARPGASYWIGAGVRIFLVGLAAAAVTPARAGDLVKARMVQRYGVSLPAGLGLVVVERMLDLLVVAGFIVGSGAFLAGNATTDAWRRASFVFAAALLLVTLVLTVASVRDAAARTLFRVLTRAFGTHPRIDSLRSHVDQLFASWDLVFASPLRLAAVMASSVLAWLLDFAKLWMILHFLEVPVPWIVVTFVYPVSLVAAILSMVPFSEGVVGLTGVTLLVALTQVDTTTAALALTLDRSISVVTPMLLWAASHVLRDRVTDESSHA